MQYYETREKEYYDVTQVQSRPGYDQSHQGHGQNHQGHGLIQSRPVYGNSPTMNHRSHGGFLDGLFKGKNGQKGQTGLGAFLGQHNSQEPNKDHGHGKLLGHHQKKTHETNKVTNGLGMFINNGEKKHKKQNEHKKKKKSKDGHGSGNESGSSSDSDSD
ncbi:hypothetical protein EUTSA_v10023733mg [Eutrema salsugineum]|uniref:Uncharacterized protein n=1 Tax=Eutrema salsugineum TaxID=72664 RepID=V4KGF0_EUTSA|nr:uncharacterized protein LOC18009623 [Eutrema salsugineum]ESQ28912.1 hypothetical protein EUTSA_v10023733mg [Eutrema salsugineum]